MSRRALVAAVAVVGAVTACRPDPPDAALPADVARRILDHGPLGPPPPDTTNAHADDPDAARLGRLLFFDPGLSGDGTRSCATCHQPERFFADGLPVADGGDEPRRNTPTVVNGAYRRVLFWDGRADTLWSQALHPLEQDGELGGTRIAVVRHLARDAALRSAYERAFRPLPDPATIATWPAAARPIPADPDHPHHRAWLELDDRNRAVVNRIFADIGKAMAAWQARIVSRRSPFDVFAEGLRDGDVSKQAALSPAARRGAILFTGRAGCVTCHAGPSFTDGSFHNLGLPAPGGGLPRDPGRYGAPERLRADPFRAAGAFSDDPEGATARGTTTAVAGPDQWGAFRTPSLRNVALTAPFMHAGQFASLAEVVSFYSTLEGQVRLDHHHESVLQPLDLSAGEQADLVAFLESLTDASLPADARPPSRADGG